MNKYFGIIYINVGDDAMYTKELEFIVKVLKDAFSKYYKIEDVLDKGDYDLVTNVDINVEEYVLKMIKETYPHDNILSEEKNSKSELIGRTWVLDPIDGTCNFARGISLFGMQMAFWDNGPKVGVIYLPLEDKLYTAIDGTPTLLNGKEVVKVVRSINKQICVFGDYTHKSIELSNFANSMHMFMKDKVMKVRMFGASCIDFGYLLDNRVDCGMIFTKNLWDILPGYILVKNAGFSLTNESNEEYQLQDKLLFVQKEKLIEVK